jgi:hypothetical protein
VLTLLMLVMIHLCEFVIIRYVCPGSRNFPSPPLSYDDKELDSDALVVVNF